MRSAAACIRSPLVSAARVRGCMMGSRYTLVSIAGCGRQCGGIAARHRGARLRRVRWFDLRSVFVTNWGKSGRTYRSLIAMRHHPAAVCASLKLRNNSPLLSVDWSITGARVGKTTMQARLEGTNTPCDPHNAARPRCWHFACGQGTAGYPGPLSCERRDSLRSGGC